jgi:hypothetical protein
MWRQLHNVGRVEAFEKMFEEIREYYPANKLKLVDLEIEKENDISFKEWKEDEEMNGTWSQSRLEDESESEKEKYEYKNSYITKDDSINIDSNIKFSK